MADGYNEPTWGDSYGDPSIDSPPQSPGNPVGYSGPNQQPFPVSGWGASAPNHADPHAEYRRQAAQHFGIGLPGPNPTGGQVPYPVVGPQARSGPGASYVNYPPNTRVDLAVTRLMQRGVRGELFRQTWFHNIRRQSPDAFVFISYGVGVVVTILLSLIPSTIFSTLVTDGLWVGIGYLYFALGTRLAHQFIEFGICLIGALVMLSRIWSTVSLMALDRSLAQMLGQHLEPIPLLMFELIIDSATAGLLVYLGIRVHRGIVHLSQR